MKTVEEILEMAFARFDSMSPTDPEKGRAALKLASVLVQVNMANQLRKIASVLYECFDENNQCLLVKLEKVCLE